MAESTSFTALADQARRRPPALALVIGSGLSGLAARLENPVSVPFFEVPEMEATTVAGHKGCLTLGTWAGKRILAFEGRLHGYEGHPWRTVDMSAQIAHRLGASILLATNAAGGIRDDLVPGCLLAITDHLDWTRPRPWQRPGPGEPGATSPYSTRLRVLLENAARPFISLLAGTYAQVTGPCYETRAEIRALKSLGTDAVGMSTAREIQAAFDLGLECAALSCITNRAAGLNGGTINHEEVLKTTGEMCERLGDLLERFLRML